MKQIELEKILDDNNWWVKFSDGGIYNAYHELVKHEDVSKYTSDLGVDEPTLHGKLTETAKALQLKNQKTLKARQIFDSITKHLKTKDYPVTLGRNERLSKFIKDVEEAFDDNEIMVTSNPRRSMIMPCLDRLSLKRVEIISIFEEWIKVAGINDVLASHSDTTSVMSLFLARVGSR